MDKLNRNDIIRINVGGKIYMTTLKLICRYKNSHLYKIVFEKLKEIQDYATNDFNKREIFIDRNGNRFEYILDFLRDGVLICENDINLLTRILIEAIYFKLFSLIKIIKKKISLLYSSMDSIINKKILKSIINSIEKKGKVKTVRLKKLTEDVSEHSELKYFNFKKKKKHRINFLNTVNVVNDVEKENSNLNEHLDDKINIRNMNTINSTEIYKNKDEIMFNKSVNFEENITNNENNIMNMNIKKDEKNSSNGILYMNNANTSDEYNITNNYLNKGEKIYNKNYIYRNYLKNDNKEDNFIPLENKKLKNIDSKSVSFSENNKFFLYNNNDISAFNDDDQINENFRKFHYDINDTNHTNYNNNNNYKHNNINKSKNHILVYSEIDDVEETSHFPIVSNVNLGEQIFSTTVDF
ncbi:conserved Plasmodium protein, unknown function [Plasmodium gallinaceum]|uniref:Potassium channel tetramerisation-type BTB domain-containing protein n=1 Tax=Plasmodium gallinaceum TaxID=5849 RepID=A0A1J1GXQ5_PLAGA|nr:conserved Plasmodium protein, unknown function [Plasmodium gallinaceum]CRG97024.1 conserved Plasmodium protein, unknown function [Plasmodium gallinaceum]